jgi:hypothetical protein
VTLPAARFFAFGREGWLRCGHRQTQCLAQRRREQSPESNEGETRVW